MGTQQYSVKNNRRNSAVCARVRVIDATLEPLTILRVLVEGLAANEQTGLWLTNMSTGIPMVPRISPFDLLYLDKTHRVLQSVELIPSRNFPVFRKPAVSALVLPFRSTASSRTRPGDLLVLIEVEEPEIEEREIEVEEPEIEMEEPEPEIEIEIGADEPQAPERIELSVMEGAAAEASESDGASFELDGSAPAEPIENAEPVAEEVLVPPDEPERSRNGDARHPGKSAALAGPVSVALVSSSERAASEPAIELPPPADTSAPAETRIVVPMAPAAASSPAAARNPAAAQSIEPRVKDAAVEEKAGEKDSGERDWVVSRFLKWLYPGAYETDRRKGSRIPIPNLVAYDTTTGVAQSFEVGDISATGMFLITEERWPPGSMLSLSIQREGPQESGTERRFQLQAWAVRLAQNGVGLSFVMPEGMGVRLWEEPARDERRQSEPEYVIREFRAARALAFAGRLAAPAIEESRYLIYEELSNVRAESAVNVLLKAEQRLAQEARGETMLAHPELLVKVIEGGSWADSGWMQDLWAGLLMASCSADACDDSNLVFVNLLSQMATLQTRVLAAICEKAVTMSSGDWVVTTGNIFLTADELARMAGTHDLLKVHRSLAQLAEFGLLEKSVRASFVSDTEGTTTNPTKLGLRMYSRCLGRRGKP
ncbi:MAG: PilZ domain-containing protein [Terracidiphilus sp.]